MACTLQDGAPMKRTQISVARLSLGTCLVSVAALLAATASALEQPAHFTAGTELADGSSARPLRMTSSQAPRVAARAWSVFQSDTGGGWMAIWDEATDVPVRVFGGSLAAPGTVASAAKAKALAETILSRHIDLLAPGASASDFVVVVNELIDDTRVVSYAQLHRGVAVVGGKLSFRFKNDRLHLIASEAIPHVHAAVPAHAIAPAAAVASAQGWVGADYGATVATGVVEGPMVLPIVGHGAVIAQRAVLKVEVESASPFGRWDVYVDAATGAPVARRQTVRFADATVLIDAPVRHPLAERADYPAELATVTIGPDAIHTDELGVLTFAVGPIDGTVALSGPQVKVFNAAGAETTSTFPFDQGASVRWSAADDEHADAQLTAFVHAKVAKDFARTLVPEMTWLNQQLEVNVNQNDVCNAYYDGTSINFYQEGGPCANTGRLADVIYHEFGHGLHHHSIVGGVGDFEEALSEGVSDYYAATITGDPAMGRGFYESEQPLRHIDPSGGEYRWPDDIDQDPHQTGLIIAGALWDLRKLLVSKYGEIEGSSITDQLYVEAMRYASDIPTMYPEILAADDDDGDLGNGTPNVCEIIEAFGAHGLRTLDVTTSTLSVAPPTQDGFDVSIAVTGLFESCTSETVEQANLVWGLQRMSTQTNTVVMTGTAGEYTGKIPAQSEGEVVLYSVELALGSGVSLKYPENPADPMYQLFVGEVTPIYCTDFEVDPAVEGWTHGLLEGEPSEGADDWQWGAPNGSAANGDPPRALSGVNIFGNDLGWGNFNGHYQANKKNYADSPLIDAAGHKNVRLQYRRWLNVEDGQFDQATVYVNGQIAWRNKAGIDPGNPDMHHTDKEWRFHDVDVTKLRGEDGKLTVRFEIASDQGYEAGGWSLEDFCVVAYDGELPTQGCGNAQIDPGEACDDGNVTAGDGCDAFCQSEDNTEAPPDEPTGPLTVGGGCGCSTAAAPRAPLALLALALVPLLRRRRRR
jgi:MYXO-CTERM domain-containing protein